MHPATSARPENIRNIVLLGSQGSGKTTLAEAMLHRCGAISRMGTINEATTAGDFEPEAKAHHYSTNSTLLFASYERAEVNIIDTPGNPEFVGYALAALQAAETAVLVVSAATGLDAHAKRLFEAAGSAGLARMIVINRIDQNPTGLKSLVEDIKRDLGPRVHCLNLPAVGHRDVVDCFDFDSGAADLYRVQDVHAEILEAAVESDDAELEKYLSGKEIPLDAMRAAFVKAMTLGSVVPLLFAAGRQEVGVDDLLHVLASEAPSPVTGRARRLMKNGVITDVACDPEAPLLAHVFKITQDPKLGALALLRMLQGKLEATTSFSTSADSHVRKAGHVFKVEGRDHPELHAVAYAGDLVALGHQEHLHVDQVIHATTTTDRWEVVRPSYPETTASLKIRARHRADDTKLDLALQRLREEDPTCAFTHDAETNDRTLSGLGDRHVKVLLERLQNRVHIEFLAIA